MTADFPMEDPPANNLACFQDQARICGPDCMAYLNPVPTGDDYVGQQWSRCLLLVNAHRAGKHLVIIASDLNKVLRGNNSPRVPPPPPVK